MATGRRAPARARDPGDGEQMAPGDGGLRELQIETLRLLVIAILGLAFVNVIVALAKIPAVVVPPWEPLPTLVGLGLTAGIVYRLLRRGPLPATGGLIVGSIATLAVLSLLYPGSWVAGSFFLVVLGASAAYDWRTGLVAALTSSAVVVVLSRADHGPVSPEVADQSLIWIWLTLLLAWLPTRPIRTTVLWAWNSYQLALTKAEEARSRQAELARVSKTLEEACKRLERVNAELAEAREAAEAARRLKAEFAATVGHELRTPINLIVGFSQMIAWPRHGTYYPEPLPDCYRHDIQTIYHNARHVSSLVDDILDLSQVDAHRMALQKKLIDVATVAHEAASNVRPLYEEAGLYLSVDVPPDLPRIVADPVRLRQILINLLYNAVRFTHQGGVVITAYPSDGELVVSVQDTGVGIPEESLGRIFEEFRQVQEPSRGHSGSGFGLAVCKRFVELHGGSIWAESALDFGTTISFSLPLTTNVASTAYASLPETTPVVAAIPDVAVFDETGQHVRVLRRYLDGYRIHRVTRLEQTSRLMRNGTLRALIVTKSDAEERWHAYQRAHPDVAAVPTLRCWLRTEQLVAHQLNVVAYLTKPIRQDQLARELRRLPKGARRFVVVEDNAEMRSLLARMLRVVVRDSAVLEAADGAEGLGLIRATRPDAVVLDLMMPSVDGYSLLSALSREGQLQHIPVVVVSARGPDETILVSTVGVSHHGGLSVGEAMTYLKAALDQCQRRSGVLSSGKTASALPARSGG